MRNFERHKVNNTTWMASAPFQIPTNIQDIQIQIGHVS